MAVVAVVTAFITVNASVAALTPVVVLMAVRLRRSPSQLLMPVAFAAHAGSLLALTGTPVNVIVSDYAAEAGVGRFGFFEFALVGVPLVVGTILIVVLFGPRLLPERAPRAITRDFSGHARTLVTAVLGQLISNMATALIVIPIALSAAADMDVSATPVLMAVAVSAAAAFLTPVATPANLMVLGPGGYRFGDYWKLGLPLLALFGVVAVLLVPVIWSL